MNNDWQDNDSPDADSLHEQIAGDSPEQMPMDMLTGGGAAGFDDFSAAPKSRSNGMLVLLAAVVIGGGSLWAMRMANSDEPVSSVGSDVEERIEAALARLSQRSDEDVDPSNATRHALDVLFRETDEVVAMFVNDPVHDQVTLDQLQKNPFELMVAIDDAESGDPAARPADNAAREREQRLAALQREKDRLRVQSVLTGSRSLAVINDEVLNVGDTIGSFEVIAIGQQGVQLEAEDELFTLRLQNED